MQVDIGEGAHADPLRNNYYRLEDGKITMVMMVMKFRRNRRRY